MATLAIPSNMPSNELLNGEWVQLAHLADCQTLLCTTELWIDQAGLSVRDIIVKLESYPHSLFISEIYTMGLREGRIAS